MALHRAGWRGHANPLASSLVVALFFDADRTLLDALDLTAGSNSLVAHDFYLGDCRATGAAARGFDYGHDARAWVPALAGLLFLGRNRPPQNQKLSDVLNGRGIERVAQGRPDRLPSFSVVRKNANLDKAMRLERGIGFFDDGGCQTVATDQHDGIKMMCVSPMGFALSWGQCNCGHPRIIGAR